MPAASAGFSMLGTSVAFRALAVASAISPQWRLLLQERLLIFHQLHLRKSAMAKIVCVLYPDPVDGYPPVYARGNVRKIKCYPGGQTVPSPECIDFEPGQLLGCVSGELGLRRFLEANGHELVVTSDKEGPNSVLDRELADAEIVISQPFWPAYLTAERIAKAPKLKLAITAGIGSDHVDLTAASERGITVAEVTFSNSISVAEQYRRLC
jgi:formate dehydrogenase